MLVHSSVALPQKDRYEFRCVEESLQMPQLVKGGKHVFGWSRVGDTGRIIIPPEAMEEYHLKDSDFFQTIMPSLPIRCFVAGFLDLLREQVARRVTCLQEQKCYTQSTSRRLRKRDPQGNR